MKDLFIIIIIINSLTSVLSSKDNVEDVLVAQERVKLHHPCRVLNQRPREDKTRCLSIIQITDRERGIEEWLTGTDR